ncbi:restriction endonuclease subunit S [Massilia sp. CCM 9210]|uniref:restriction endonuclease subunit S n=1 Tax=Massilia scottii TaxID=3057166 RepID=UPI0027969E8A|nr:restriction endonuclease subunit S [Massilia sp. CCM 9210]MDQ1817433.1 restriction endonuclease subunit S [Massilia sp. CCM 9210]
MSEIDGDGWSVSSFGALCLRIVNGGTPDTGIATYWNGETPWITGADFTENGIGEFRRYVSDEGIRSSTTSVVKQGNLLVVTRTGVGKLAIAPCNIAISQDITGIYINAEKAGANFVYYLLSRELDELKKLNQGTSINGIIRSDLEKHIVRLPASKTVQNKITAILTTIDRAIERTEALIAKYQQIKAGLMRDLFTRGVLPNGKLRPPRSEAPELYYEAAIGWIPREWTVSGLASKGRPGTSWIRTGPFGSALKGEHWRSHGHPVITIGALGEGVFTSEELLFVTVKDASRLLDFQLKPDDVVFSRVADVGRSVVVRDEQAGWIMSSNLMRIAVDKRSARPDFLQMALAGDERIKAQIRERVNTGGRDVANSEVLNQLRFVWPDISEQDRIIALSSHASRNLILEQQNAAKFRLQKLGLMQDLLTGKVAVKVGNPEADCG